MSREAFFILFFLAAPWSSVQREESFFNLFRMKRENPSNDTHWSERLGRLIQPYMSLNYTKIKLKMKTYISDPFILSFLIELMIFNHIYRLERTKLFF